MGPDPFVGFLTFWTLVITLPFTDPVQFAFHISLHFELSNLNTMSKIHTNSHTNKD